MPRDVAIRVSMQDGETVRRALMALGTDGEAALKRLEKAGIPASAGLRAVDAAVKETALGIENLAARTGAGGSVLRAFGPAGLAAAAGIGAIVVAIGAVISKSREAADAFDNLQDSADRIGVSTEFLQGLKFAVGQKGGDIEKTEAALDKLNAVMGNVANGGAKEAAEAFKRIGVTVKDSQGELKSLERFLPELADGYAKLGSAQERASFATEVFGRGNQAFARVLADGADGLRRQIDLAREMGAVVDEELVRKGADAKDKLEALAMVVNAQLNGAVIDAVPAITAMAQAFADLAKWIGYTADAWKSLPDQRLETMKDTVSKLREELSHLQAEREDLTWNPGPINSRLNQAADTSEYDRKINALRARIAQYDAEISAREYLPLESQRFGRNTQAPDTTGLDEFSASVQETIDKLEVQAEKARLAGRELAVYEALLGHESATEKERAAITAEAIKAYEAEEAKAASLKRAREAAAAEKKKETEAEREHQKALNAGERLTEQVITAEEKRAKSLREINSLLEVKAINETTAARARAKVENDYLDDRTDAGAGFERYFRDFTADAQDAASGVEDALSDAFSNSEAALERFVQTGKFQWKDLVSSIIEDLGRLALELAKVGMMQAIGAALGGASLPGADAIPGVGPAGMGFLSFGGPRAGGGDVWPGSVYEVGELGRERFIPKVPGTIVPHHVLQNAGGAGTGPTLSFAPVTQVDARGADAGILQRIEAMLKARDREWERNLPVILNKLRTHSNS